MKVARPAVLLFEETVCTLIFLLPFDVRYRFIQHQYVFASMVSDLYKCKEIIVLLATGYIRKHFPFIFRCYNTFTHSSYFRLLNLFTSFYFTLRMIRHVAASSVLASLLVSIRAHGFVTDPRSRGSLYLPRIIKAAGLEHLVKEADVGGNVGWEDCPHCSNVCFSFLVILTNLSRSHSTNSN